MRFKMSERIDRHYKLNLAFGPDVAVTWRNRESDVEPGAKAARP